MATAKLISTKQTLLGTVTFPNSWLGPLESGTVRFQYENPGRSLLHHIQATAVYQTCQIASLSVAYGPIEGVTLFGIAPEEFERLPGCSFAPSAAYMRSLIGGDT